MEVLNITGRIEISLLNKNKLELKRPALYVFETSKRLLFFSAHYLYDHMGGGSLMTQGKIPLLCVD